MSTPCTPLQSPLTRRAPGASFAHLHSELACLDGRTGPVTTEQFLAHVVALADQLPDLPNALNLCENRYLFTVAFCAVLSRGQTNLLPPNKASQTLQALSTSYASYGLHDADLSAAIPGLDLRTVSLTAPAAKPITPLIDSHQVAAICFTSGSTGQSQPIVKTWATLAAANHHNARFMLAGLNQTAHQIATVPGQHMWGLETTVLLPLVADLVLSDAKPFYPADIAELAQQLPGPRVMVSTPIHLRALVNAGIEIAPMERVLCATAPLPQPLAQQVTQLTGGTIAEVYGCSEMGSMAVRDTAKSQTWNLFDAFQLQPLADGRCRALASHINDSVVLGDYLDVLTPQQFTLHGRTDDSINIAGKRGSLAEINRVLLQCQGLEDGVVFLPPAKQRLAAMVVLKPEFSVTELTNYFRQHIDAAFVPRPILVSTKLPRSDNGKLSQAAISQHFAQLKQR